MTPSEAPHARSPRRSRAAVYTAAAVAVLAVAGTATATAGTGDHTSAAGTKDDGTQAAVTQKWGKPVGGDEFDGKAVDESKWTRYGDYPGHDGNGMRLKEKDTVGGGHLTVSGDKDGNTGGVAWKKGQTHGRWEARMRVQQKDGGGNPYHPVLILWPDSDKWPDDGELDYAESDAGSTKMQAFLHYGNGSENGGQDPYTYDQKLDTSKWHNYAVEWTGDHIAGYIDGKEWFKDTNPKAQPPGPMHQTIQLDDFFPEGNLNPATMDVDWVRMYDV